MAKRCCRIYDFLIIDATAPNALSRAVRAIKRSSGACSRKSVCMALTMGRKPPFGIFDPEWYGGNVRKPSKAVRTSLLT